MTIVGLMLALIVSTSTNEIHQDSTYTLRYNLPVGTAYTYQVTTDQFVIRNTGVRLHTSVMMEVIGHDENGNSICRFRLRSDTAHREDDDEFIYRPIGSLNFAGHKLYAEAGHVELLLDPYGKLVDNTPTEEDLNKMPEVVTQFQRVVDASINDPDIMGEGGSYMLNLVLPATPRTLSLDLHKEYTDTVVFDSRAVHMPSTYGSQAIEARTIDGAVPDVRLMLKDTLYRITVLDSVVQKGNQTIGFMTFKNVRYNALGSHFVSTTHIERDMTTGLIKSVKEKCYRTKGDKETLAYFAKAELIHTEAIKTAKY